MLSKEVRVSNVFSDVRFPPICEIGAGDRLPTQGLHELSTTKPYEE